MLRRQKSRIEACKYKILVVGEQIRFQMHVQSVVDDRRYHMRQFHTCFVGREAVDWLVLNRHARTRDEAIVCMRILQDLDVFHHVCDEHQFRDEYLFYRFRRDDETHLQNKDMRAFYKGQLLFEKLHATRGVIHDFHPTGCVYRDAFVGRVLIDWMVENGMVYTRESAIKDCRELLENDVIKHVTDDFHFKDDDHVYQFSLDFHQPHLLSDILRFRRTSSSSSSSTGRSSSDPIDLRKRTTPVPTKCSTDSSSTHSSDSSSCSLSSVRPTDAVTPCSYPEESEPTQPKSVLIRHASVQELEDPDTPYTKQVIRMVSDSVGFGFVIRGEGPAYVQTVDPCGPAAAAGIKVRQYIYSVDGHNVLRLGNKEIGQRILQEKGMTTLVVMAHKRDAVG